MKQARLVGVDWLRGISAYGIVGCHLALPNMTQGALRLASFMDLFVGVFAMLAGFFFLQSCEKFDSWGSYIKQRAVRLLIPYLFWSLAYIGIDLMMDLLLHKPQLSFQPFDAYYWFRVICRGDAAASLWFLIALFYAQFLGYPCARLIKRVSKPFITASFLLGVGFLMLAYIVPRGDWYSFYLLRLFAFFGMGIAISLLKDYIQQFPAYVWGGGGYS